MSRNGKEESSGKIEVPRGLTKDDRERGEWGAAN